MGPQMWRTSFLSVAQNASIAALMLAIAHTFRSWRRGPSRRAGW